MYIVEDKVIDNIHNTACQVLQDRGWDYDFYIVKEIIKKSLKRKQPLLDLLSKHPNWNPEKLMIQFDEDYSRQICTAQVHDFADWLYRYINKHDYCFWAEQTATKEYQIYEFFYNLSEEFFNPEMKEKIDKINALNDSYKLRTNMKTSKAIGKICREEGWDKIEGDYKEDGYNYQYAALCDCLSPIKTTRHTCISLNFVDFLLMSNGDSWHSCHNIEDANDPGCYCSGTISYALDECSFVFYTVDASYSGNSIELQPKHQREIFGYNDEVFVQSRLYPQSLDAGAEQIYADIRAIVQKIIADCLEKPNLWIKTTSDVNEIVEQGEDATCYPDWESGNPGCKHCSISTLKMRPPERTKRIILGAQPICIECGSYHDIDNSINCCNSGRRCEKCGERIEPDEERWVGDYCYCADCTVYCEDCGNYEVYDDAIEVCKTSRWGRASYYVCEYCYNNGSYHKCSECGDMWREDDMDKTEEGNWYCPECNNGWFECEDCGCLHDWDGHYEDEETGCLYCEECYDKIMEEREVEADEEAEAV